MVRTRTAFIGFPAYSGSLDAPLATLGVEIAFSVAAALWPARAALRCNPWANNFSRSLSERGKSKNLDLVFDKSGASLNRFSPILFSPDGMDFTAEVIVELNKRERTASPAKPKSNKERRSAVFPVGDL